jgi:hypothetical protein
MLARRRVGLAGERSWAVRRTDVVVGRISGVWPSCRVFLFLLCFLSYFPNSCVRMNLNWLFGLHTFKYQIKLPYEWPYIIFEIIITYLLLWLLVVLQSSILFLQILNCELGINVFLLILLLLLLNAHTNKFPAWCTYYLVVISLLITLNVYVHML